MQANNKKVAIVQSNYIPWKGYFDMIAAVGKARMITAYMVKAGAVVIDVGVNRQENGKLAGDGAFDEVAAKASHITPVSGGVGPMTIAMLTKNTLDAARIAR